MNMLVVLIFLREILVEWTCPIIAAGTAAGADRLHAREKNSPLKQGVPAGAGGEAQDFIQQFILPVGSG
jgi:hypothetical protein